MRALRSAAASFFLFLAVGLAVAWPSLRWPMVYDDLHLLRSFTPAEKAGAWSGSWDPDGIEHAGLRPLTLLFNDLRYRLFVEDVAAHRVFVIVLLALYARLLVALGAAAGLPPPAGVAAGLLLLCSRYTAYHLVWLTDGNHAVQGLLFSASALALLRGLREGRRPWVWLAGSLSAFAAAALVREDVLALGPVLLLLGAAAASRPHRRALVGFAAGVIVLTLALFAYRARAVPEAPAPGLDLAGFGIAAGRTLILVGPESFDGISGALVWTWTAAPVLVLAALLGLPRPPAWRAPVVFLAAAVVAATPALTFRRDDMLFFPVSFAALFYGGALEALARRGTVLRAAAAALLLSGVLGGAYVSRTFALNFHPDSARAIRWNAQMIYGRFADRATIPAERRAAMVRQLAGQGVASEADLRPLGVRIVGARVEGPFRPATPGTLFFPPLLERDF